MNHLLAQELSSRDLAKTGGWWCMSCQQATELDLEREQNVCGICGRPTVKYLPPVKSDPATELRPPVHRPYNRRTIKASIASPSPRCGSPGAIEDERPVSASRGALLFAALRAAVDGSQESGGEPPTTS